MNAQCPICQSTRIDFEVEVDGYDYFSCQACESIFLDTEFLAYFDEGRPLREYDANYWLTEDVSARERSFGSSLARLAEVVLYTRRPIDRFLDIGAGAGYLLDAVKTYLPASAFKFWGIEKFPPSNRSFNPQYIVGSVGDLDEKYDAGMCIEVVEHLTPTQLTILARQLASRSQPDALFLINTGMPAFVREHDHSYLDPIRRGHIVSYGLKAIELIFGSVGFRVHAMRGRDWAYVVEYQPVISPDVPLEDRIWTAPPENRAILHDPQMGNLLYCTGIDAARAYR